MFIYCLRHAPAVARAEANITNDDRQLTKDGRKKMEAAARGILRVVEEPIDVILTSPLSRARDTALIAAEALGMQDRVTVCSELSPGASYEMLREALLKHQAMESIMLVGHAPDVNIIASSLLGSDLPIVDLKKGALCCIEIESLTGPRQGTLLWLLQPKQLRQLAE